MKRVSISGASKGIGLETTRQALEAGHHARALARSAAGMAFSDPNLETVRGDALTSRDVEAALTGRCKILSEPSQWRNGIISRSDVAEFRVRQIEDQTYLRQTPVLVK